MFLLEAAEGPVPNSWSDGSLKGLKFRQFPTLGDRKAPKGLGPMLGGFQAENAQRGPDFNHMRKMQRLLLGLFCWLDCRGQAVGGPEGLVHGSSIFQHPSVSLHQPAAWHGLHLLVAQFGCSSSEKWATPIHFDNGASSSKAFTCLWLGRDTLRFSVLCRG